MKAGERPPASSLPGRTADAPAGVPAVFFDSFNFFPATKDAVVAEVSPSRLVNDRSCTPARAWGADQMFQALSREQCGAAPTHSRSSTTGLL